MTEREFDKVLAPSVTYCILELAREYAVGDDALADAVLKTKENSSGALRAPATATAI